VDGAAAGTAGVTSGPELLAFCPLGFPEKRLITVRMRITAPIISRVFRM